MNFDIDTAMARVREAVRPFPQAALFALADEATARRSRSWWPADLHRTYISLRERGLRNPSVDALLLLTTVLGVAASQLITEAEAENEI